MKLHWTRLALGDMRAISAYIAEDRPASAADVAERIQQSAAMLRIHPMLGRPGRLKGSRELVVVDTPFIILYRVNVKEDRTEILGVIHGARRWPGLF